MTTSDILGLLLSRRDSGDQGRETGSSPPLVLLDDGSSSRTAGGTARNTVQRCGFRAIHIRADNRFTIEPAVR